MPDYSALRMDFDNETKTVSISGVNPHSLDHIFKSLLMVSGILNDSCAMAMYNTLAGLYNDLVPNLPAEVMAPLDQAVEQMMKELDLGLALGLAPVDTEIPDYPTEE